MKSEKQKEHLQKLIKLRRERGDWHNSETKEKISRANRGRFPWNKGRVGVYSEETRKKMGESRIGKKPKNWKGGSWVYWRAEIIKRDKNCVICGENENLILEVAHITPIKGIENRVMSGHELNTYENLVTLCPNCHKKFDRGLIDKNILYKYAKNP